MNIVAAIKTIFIGSGAGWVLWLLGVLSVASVAIALERWLFYRKKGGDLRALGAALDERLSSGEVDGAIADLQKSPALAASIAAAGLRLASLGPAAVDRAMQSATALERSLLEKRLAYLGTLGNNAPFIGLFGTVIGVIQAFEELGHGAPGHGMGAGTGAGGQMASQAVMSGIAEALVATAVGIAVALPAVAAYNYLQRRLASLIASADVLSNLVLAYLLGSGSAPPSDPRSPAPAPRGGL